MKLTIEIDGVEIPLDAKNYKEAADEIFGNKYDAIEEPEEGLSRRDQAFLSVIGALERRLFELETMVLERVLSDSRQFYGEETPEEEPEEEPESPPLLEVIRPKPAPAVKALKEAPMKKIYLVGARLSKKEELRRAFLIKGYEPPRLIMIDGDAMKRITSLKNQIVVTTKWVGHSQTISIGRNNAMLFWGDFESPLHLAKGLLKMEGVTS